MRRLVIRPGAIGDLIVSLPALECLRADYLEVWTATANVPLVRFAGRVRGIATTGLDLLGVTAPPAPLLEELRSFDSIVSWYGANRPEFRELTSSLGLPIAFLQALPAHGPGRHATDFYLDQVRSIASCVSDGIPRIPCMPVPRNVEGENFAVIHPFSGSPRKNWPLENFRYLARELERTMPVLWCAGPEDPPLPGAVQIPNLYDLACWLARASVYVGNDSGITHLAAAVGTPVLALFGPTDPAVWAPRGPHVQVVRWQTGPLPSET
ncbi:MAG TPA: glycosyltransferase family 9 protein [Candidatus Acidoferrales bacterium]|nr:glycosyltransferase family 9 protein [Candidatus Acidoferrales bacterium]